MMMLHGGADVPLCTVQANMSANEEDKLPEDEILGQMAYGPTPALHN